jgi:tetratricopeptide (TPR) repeat protein
MRRILIGMALVLVAMSASAQSIEKNIAKCGSKNVDISISACTAMLRAKPAMSPKWQLAAYFMRGNAYLFGKKDYDRAIADFTSALVLEPDTENSPQFHAGIGMAYLHKQLFAESIASTSKAIELKPDESGGYRVRGYAYELSGQRDKAIADYRMALKFDPEAENLKAALIRLGVTP